jgi:hypothetical protein
MHQQMYTIQLLLHSEISHGQFHRRLKTETPTELHRNFANIYGGGKTHHHSTDIACSKAGKHPLIAKHKMVAVIFRLTSVEN